MDLVGSFWKPNQPVWLVMFQSFWVNGFGWKKIEYSEVLRLKDGFNPSESMDLVGSCFDGSYMVCELSVSILLSQWIWLEVFTICCGTPFWPSFNPSESMDLVGRRKAKSRDQFAFLFQSFWVNGFGWKRIHTWLLQNIVNVSILLSQWIWLEETCSWFFRIGGDGFNPSESMDLVGSTEAGVMASAILVFQSFWVNGFGWKPIYTRLAQTIPSFQSFWVNGFGWKSLLLQSNPHSIGVSILLSQWIWLEEIINSILEEKFWGFNPSESMDLVGSLCRRRSRTLNYCVSILLSQWIWLEGSYRPLGDRFWICFNPSESMDLVGSADFLRSP